jgi:hypothetical protein
VSGAHEDHAILTGPCPCDGCRYAAACGVQLLACERFSMFMAGEGQRRWHAAPMAPSRARYAAIFEAIHHGGPGRPRKSDAVYPSTWTDEARP